MIINYNLLVYILSGITFITMLNIGGAVASRKLNFNFGFLSPISFAIYTVIGFLISKESSLDKALACNILIGMFDGTIGWYLLMKLKANTGQAEGELIEITEVQRVIITSVIAGVFGMIGYMLVHNVNI